MSIKEKRNLFYSIIRKSNVSKYFDDNIFYEALTTDEKQIANKIEYWRYVELLKKRLIYKVLRY